jgi:MFS family permease
MLAKMRSTYHEFPRNFWILVGAAFVDRLGGALVFPFFAVYITQRFNVGMTQVGQLFALFSVTGMIGGVLGGAMADKFGRKKMMIFGLVFSFPWLSTLGIVFFAGAVAFYLVTLPVEFDASRRAIATIRSMNILSEEETEGARKVLRAAAMTYVASALMAILQLLRLVLLSNSRRRD